MSKSNTSHQHTFPNEVKYLISDIDGVLTTDDKKEIAPGIPERLREIKRHGVTIILNTLRWATKYGNIIHGEIANTIEFGISERGAIQIGKQQEITPLIHDSQELKEYNTKIEDKLLAMGLSKWAWPYNCVQYYFADNQTCAKLIKQIHQEDRYIHRDNNFILEDTSQWSIILTQKGVDKWYGILASIDQNNLKNTIVLWDDKVDESMFLLPNVYSCNVWEDKTLYANYTSHETWYRGTIKILDELLTVFDQRK